MMYLLTAAQTVWLPDQASTIASEVDSLFYFILYWTVFFLLLVALVTFYFSWKYRDIKKKGLTSSLDHNTLLEIVWTLIPFILVMIVFFWGARTYIKMNVVPYGAMQIDVTAKQWKWYFHYDEGITSPDVLTVPVNTPIKLEMQSPDVLHSLYIPDFRVKMDIIPNRYTQLWFEATEEGEFDIFCTEYCGKEHSLMLGKVKVVSDKEFQEFLSKSDSDMSLFDLGELVYTKKHACNSCHSIDGTPLIGPSFKGIWNKEVEHEEADTEIVNATYIRESILYPQEKIVKGYKNKIMSTYQGLISDREIKAIIKYIECLENDERYKECLEENNKVDDIE